MMMQKLSEKKNKKGFTLIELIVVIAILAILAAIAIPRFTGYTTKAKDAADHQYAALVGNAIVTLMAEGTVTTAGHVPLVNSTGNLGTITGLNGLTQGGVSALVAPKPLQGTKTVDVAVTAEGVVTITQN